MTNTDSLVLVSADAHVEEPHDLWFDNLPASMRDTAPRRIRHKGDGSWELVVNGVALHGSTKTEEEDRIRAVQPESRLQAMRDDGVSGECVFPSIGLYVWGLEDAAVGEASCRIYNDWVYDLLESKSPRFRCAGLIPMWSPEEAVKEVERIAAMGLASAMLPIVANPEYNRPHWEPLWTALEQAALPVVLHQGTGHDMLFYGGPGASVSNLLATQSMAPRSVALLSTSGVLERHPNLHFVFVEVNAGWMAWTMETLDWYYEHFKGYGWINPELAELPSHYIAEQIHATFQYDPVAMTNIERTGVRPLLWGNDFPHDEGTYPHSRQTVQKMCENLSRDDAASILGKTAADIFQFDPDVLTTAV